MNEFVVKLVRTQARYVRVWAKDFEDAASKVDGLKEASSENDHRWLNETVVLASIRDVATNEWKNCQAPNRKDPNAGV